VFEIICSAAGNAAPGLIFIDEIKPA